MKTFGLCLSVLSLIACSKDTSVHSNGTDKEDQSNQDSSSDSQNTHRFESLSISQQVDGAINDLTQRKGVKPEDIEVRRAVRVVWGSSALGCPQPGLNYTQVAVTGLLVMLEVGETMYRYHGKEGHPLIFCPEDRAKAPAYGPGEDVM